MVIELVELGSFMFIVFFRMDFSLVRVMLDVDSVSIGDISICFM